MTRAGIHQPNFFPWLGFFNRIYKSDVFIFFDHVQKPGGRSWISRVKVRQKNNAVWMTAPIKKSGNSNQKINEVEFLNSSSEIFLSINRKLTDYYKGSSYLSQILKILESGFVETAYLSEFNISMIKTLSTHLNLNTEFERSSDKFSGPNELFKSEMILETCKRFDVTEFVSGSFAFNNLIDLQDFHANNVKVTDQNFVNPDYTLGSEKPFIEGLSIIDCLVLFGVNRTREILAEA